MLDSGLGGLSVLRALTQALPMEDFLYCADCGNAPWGDKPQDFIVSRAEAICSFLLAHKAKAIVLACNTATAVAADVLREHLSVPVIGIEPAVKPAAASSKRKAIGVLATTRTIESARYESLIARFAAGVKVVSVAAPGLMECVEAGDFTGEKPRRLLEAYLAPMQKAGIDKLVLGCTHYPFLSPLLTDMLGPDVELVDPGPAVAAVTKTRLSAIGELRSALPAAAGETVLPAGTNPEPGRVRFFIKDARRHTAVLKRLWPQAEEVDELGV